MKINLKKYISAGLLIATLFACQSDPQNKKEEPKASSEQSDAASSETVIDNSADSSLNEINQKIREDLNNPELYVDRSSLYLELGDIQAAIKDLDRAYRIDTTNLKTLMAQADFFTRRGKLEAAMRVLEKSQTYHPEHSDLYVRKAELYLIGKNYKKSLENADIAVKYDIYNEKAYFVKAFDFLALGDTTKAISSFRTTIEQNPEYYEGYLQLGLLFSDLDDPIAISYFENALEVRPNDRDALYSKGMFEQEHEMYNEAMQTYTQAIKAHPDFREAYYNMGYVHMYYLKLYSQGLQYFDQAIKVDPNYYQAYYNRGYSFELMGDIKNAAIDYRNSLKIQPDYTLAAKGLERVQDDIGQAN